MFQLPKKLTHLYPTTGPWIKVLFLPCSSLRKCKHIRRMQIGIQQCNHHRFVSKTTTRKTVNLWLLQRKPS
jgi:hypothetical protein